MLTQGETEAWLAREPRFDDLACSLQAAPGIPAAMVGETRRVVALARKFNREVVRPRALSLDRRMSEEPDTLPWDFVEEANRAGFYTLWIPKLFGGRGCNMLSLSYFLEEIASGCLAMANLIGVHYLAVAALCATWNLSLIRRIFRDVAEGERNGTPRLISTAITEPSAGTDVEEVELLDRGRVTCRARAVPGGYVVNGRKVFISNGHLSHWHMLVAYTEPDRPSRTMLMMAVQNGAKGFSFGRLERKMGQKACPASELVFEDCFVPRELVAFDLDEGFAGFRRERREIVARILDYVLSTSRAGVCALGAGAARGAFEDALDAAGRTKLDGRLLLSHQWAQSKLAEMYKNAAVARLAFNEANYANTLYGLFRVLHWKPFYYACKYVPRGVLDRMAGPILESRFATRLARKAHLEWKREEQLQRVSGWGSLAKFVGTDMALKNCQLALELLGQAGVRHEGQIEKRLRDAKLLQIYEGTNQLNRLNLFRCLIGRGRPEVALFEPLCRPRERATPRHSPRLEPTTVTSGNPAAMVRLSSEADGGICHVEG